MRRLRRAAGAARLICWVMTNFLREHREQGPPDLPAEVDDGQVDSVRGRSNVMDTAQQFLFEIMG